MMAEMWHEVSHVCDHSNEAGQLLFICGGGVISVIPCIFFGQGCMPSALYSTPKNETLGRLSSNFLLFSTKPSIWATLRRVTRLASWSSSVIVDTYDSRAPLHDEVHLHLEDIL